MASHLGPWAGPLNSEVGRAVFESRRTTCSICIESNVGVPGLAGTGVDQGNKNFFQ
mgnify:CR=1 FL=1